jgi:limonene-1,2-epoxide hydrolase
MSPEIQLSAPGLRTTRGWSACQEVFRRTFEVLPDLTARVHRWSADGETLFIEMTFRATIGGRLVEWDNVDRFLFRDGRAVERVAYFDPTRIAGVSPRLCDAPPAEAMRR